MNTVKWNFTRPVYPYHISKQIPIEELVTNFYKDDVASISFELFASSYVEESSTYLADYILFKLVFSANLTKGFVYGLQIRFTAILNSAEELDINQDEDWIETRNLSLPSSHDSSYWTASAYISARAAGSPNNCYLKMLANWFFFDKTNINHETVATATLVLYNGSDFVKIQLPIEPKILL